MDRRRQFVTANKPWVSMPHSPINTLSTGIVRAAPASASILAHPGCGAFNKVYPPAYAVGGSGWLRAAASKLAATRERANILLVQVYQRALSKRRERSCVRVLATLQKFRPRISISLENSTEAALTITHSRLLSRTIGFRCFCCSSPAFARCNPTFVVVLTFSLNSLLFLLSALIARDGRHDVDLGIRQGQQTVHLPDLDLLS